MLIIFSIGRMLRRLMALNNNHLYLTDSETESDDLSEYSIFKVKKELTKEFVLGKEDAKLRGIRRKISLRMEKKPRI